MPENPDSKLINELFAKYRQTMFKIAFGILHNKSDAEDAVQNAFLWIINNVDKISQIPCYERGFYFATIIEHISINLINKQKRHPSEDIEAHPEFVSDRSVEEQANDNIMIKEIERALEELSDRDYSLMYLSVFKQMKHKEIAEALDIPEKNINVYIERARKRLIKILKKRGIVDDI